MTEPVHRAVTTTVGAAAHTAETVVGKVGRAAHDVQDALQTMVTHEKKHSDDDDDLEVGEERRLSLYQETRAMLSHCSMVYTIAEYRVWAANTSIPLDGAAVEQLALECRDQYMTKYADNGGEKRARLMQAIVDSWKETGLQIIRFEDSKHEEELVYMICVEPALKRIVLVFRGSVSKQDFSADLRAYQAKVDIQGRGLPEHYRFATLHGGFYDYLFGVKKKKKSPDAAAAAAKDEDAPTAAGNSNNDNDDATDRTSNKYDTIRQHLREAFALYPGFRLYVTGHSLGGALCTLFSVFYSTEPTPDTDGTNTVLPDTVSCFSFASPKVGTQGFQRLIQWTEMETGRLRFVRTVNHRDPVTNVPKDIFLTCQADLVCGMLMNTVCQTNMFRHGGMELRNYPPSSSAAQSDGTSGSGRFTIGHLPHDGWTFRFCPLCASDTLKTIVRYWFLLYSALRCLLCVGEDFRNYHGWLKYMEWIDANEEELNQLYLDDLYDAVKEGDYSLLKKRY